MNPKKHAEELRRANGLPVALRIALTCMKATAISQYGSIPVGEVFGTADKKNSKNFSLDTRNLIKLHGHWVSVFNTLKKMKG